MTHELKIEPQYFEAVLDGSKTFEVRYNDRDYQKGDMVILREWGPIFNNSDGFPWGYTDRRLSFKIGYVSTYNQKEGWVVFSLLPVKEKE